MTRGVIGDKWSIRILWLCAIGSAAGEFPSLFFSVFRVQFQVRVSTKLSPLHVLFSMIQGLYMVAVERQAQNRERALSQGLGSMDIEENSSGEEV